MKKNIRRRPVPLGALEIFNDSKIPEVLWPVYAARGVDSLEYTEYSMAGILRPNQLKGLNDALDLLVFALQNNQKICVVGDFDADGATSTALSVKCLRAFGHSNVEYLVPNRFDFGYGLSPEIVEVVSELHPDLIVTVDNGIASVSGVAAAKSKGIKVLVTDHHLAGAELPDADAIVNPNQPGCGFENKALAGVGVIFYVLSALRGRLRSENWFVERGIAEPNMAEFLDLVALGTVADVVPLNHNNRILVQQGIRRMRAEHCSHGIRAIVEISGRSLSRLSTSDLGFAVGPRLNAAGRLDDMTLGIRCLLAETASEAAAIARELDDLNRDRKSIEQGMQEEAFKELQRIPFSQQEYLHGICVYQSDWHQGVIGILASRVKDKLHRPAIALAKSDDGSLKGSGRSIPGIHLRDVLDKVATQHPGLLTKFGGHAMAAGLSLSEENLESFQRAFNQAVAEVATDEVLEAVLWTDGELHERDLTLEVAQLLKNGGPWGQQFPEPVFDGVFRIVQQRLVGQKHLKLVLAPGEYTNAVIDGIFFNCDLSAWPDDQVQYVKVVYKLDINEYMGNQSPQLLVDYMEPVSGF